MKSSARLPLPAVRQAEVVGDVAVEEELDLSRGSVEKSQLRGPGWRGSWRVVARAHRALGFQVRRAWSSASRARCPPWRRSPREPGRRAPLLGFLEIDVGHVDRVAGDAGAARGFLALLLDHVVEAVQACRRYRRWCRSCQRGHFVHFGGGLLDLEVGERSTRGPSILSFAAFTATSRDLMRSL